MAGCTATSRTAPASTTRSCSTITLYRQFGALPIASITADDVRAWHAKMGTTTPTLRAHCYGLLRTIMGTAASDGKITANPCVIRGAGNAKRVHKIRPASLAEIAVIGRGDARASAGAWCCSPPGARCGSAS